jgi:hypothetical protein
MSAPKIPRGKTGPTTPAGKATSSRNASKHHCTSTSLIVPGESQTDFAALLESLTMEYQPETDSQKITVAQTARTIWDLARVNREFDKSQHALYSAQKDMREWDASQQSEFDRMLRYRTKAERAYQRALQQVEYIRKLHLQAAQRAFWENLQTEKLGLSRQRLKLSTARWQQTETKPSATAAATKDKGVRATVWPTNIAHLSQIIQISVHEGTISFQLHPQPEDMHLLADHAETGAQVLRRFEFPGGVPAEYAWVNEPGIRRNGIVWEQHFSNVHDWRQHVAREEAAGKDCYLPVRKPL